MKRQDPVLRLAVLFIALSLGLVVAVATWRGYFRGFGPEDPRSFRIQLDQGRRNPSPQDVATHIQIHSGGAYDVIEASGCDPELDFISDDWVAPCAMRTVSSGAIETRDLMTLRNSVRSAGFYRWRNNYSNAFGNTDAARICVEEAGKTRCVLVRHSIYFSRSGPGEFWIIMSDIDRLVGREPGWRK